MLPPVRHGRHPEVCYLGRVPFSFSCGLAVIVKVDGALLNLSTTTEMSMILPCNSSSVFGTENVEEQNLSPSSLTPLFFW